MADHVGPRVEARRQIFSIVESKAVPVAEQRDVVEIDPQRKFRPQIYWYLSFRCNLACTHCSVKSSPTVDTSGDLTTVQAMRVIEQMAELNVSTCIMTGGEVLIRPDALDLLQSLGDHGIRVALETNGLSFSKRFVEISRELQGRGKLEMTISLDGGTEETHDRLRGKGAFRRTMRGLQFLKDNGVHFNIQCVLNNSNIETIPILYDIAAALRPEMRHVVFSLLNPVGRGEGLVRDLGISFRDLNRILDLVKQNKPKFPGGTVVKAPPAAIPPQHLAMVFKDQSVRSMVSCQFPLLGILPNGDVTICALSRDNEDLYFGNVMDLSLKEIWQRTRMDMLRSRYLATDHLAGVCGDCIWKQSCKGGCRAWAYEEGQSFDSPFPLCAALDEAGEFPEAYRLSKQRSALPQDMPQTGCFCG
jgi:radical SAM protein with 4Fe4S-binding SPASM domain